MASVADVWCRGPEEAPGAHSPAPGAGSGNMHLFRTVSRGRILDANVRGKEPGKLVVRVLRITAGFALLLVGIVGWLLPVLPGWPFVIPGLILLGREFHWARRTLEWLQKFHPRKSSSEPRA